MNMLFEISCDKTIKQFHNYIIMIHVTPYTSRTSANYQTGNDVRLTCSVSIIFVLIMTEFSKAQWVYDMFH